MSENIDFSMDAGALCREEVFTDQRVGTIRILTPVTADGTRDEDRPVQYVGSASLMTPMGSLPLSFEIEADSLGEAVSGYGEAAKIALDETMKELQELRRQQQSGIVVPGAGGQVPGGGMPGGGMPGGGMPGGGIKMP